MYQSVVGNLSSLNESNLIISPSQLAAATDHTVTDADDLSPIHMDTDVEDAMTPSAHITLHTDTATEVASALNAPSTSGTTVKIEAAEQDVEYIRVGGRTLKVVKIDPTRQGRLGGSGS